MHDFPDLPFDAAIEAIKATVPSHLQSPRVGIVCGSGLSGLVDSIRDLHLVPYNTIPGFAESTVPGHKSSLAFGLMGSGEGVPVVAMLGRFHPYEGHDLRVVVYPIRVMARLGITNLILTNAAGGLNPNLAVGTIVALHDHLALPNMTGMNALLGPLTSSSHARFVPLSDAYSPALRRLLFLGAHHLGLSADEVTEGTYAWVSGPTYESPAEGRFLRLVGADVVGMSTVPEVLAARQEGLNVMALSLVTNAVVIPETYRDIRAEVATELAGKPVELPPAQVVSHEEVLEIGKAKGQVMMKLVEYVVSALS
ncbi:Purine nucleoside phosphorylase [Mycena indigotica]|uniref:Purine nucleoside phosphorylase n=1 Tax=Mycena indigotica TaxID=2126181 RepID=A0A8H6SLX4_9AGAR|nr:Purine nucleoside phosphorylase [Mycena indigotica]KAF7301245.1 Purine nucleoside phosphorylase [Mycena indigotica]